MSQNDYPTVNELSNGFSEFKLDSAKEFDKTICLYDEKGGKTEFDFIDAENLKVTDSGSDITVKYTMVSPRDRIFLLDYFQSEEEAISITIAMDFNQGIATILRAQLPTKEQADVSLLIRAEKNMPMTSVTAEFIHASIDTPFTDATPKHEFTKELVGKRVQFQYSENDRYEHIYLNEKFYTWHCIGGIELGLCDTDRCYYLKLADNLYWFTWLEKIVPTIGTVLEDLDPDVMRSFGKIAGYEDYYKGGITNFQVGSYATEV